MGSSRRFRRQPKGGWSDMCSRSRLHPNNRLGRVLRAPSPHNRGCEAVLPETWPRRERGGVPPKSPQIPRIFTFLARKSRVCNTSYP